MIGVTVKFSPEFRKRLSEKLMELGNIIAGALIFTPFLSKNSFSIIIYVLGITLTTLCYCFSYFISDFIKH
jgi:hypothetical protein